MNKKFLQWIYNSTMKKNLWITKVIKITKHINNRKQVTNLKKLIQKFELDKQKDQQKNLNLEK